MCDILKPVNMLSLYLQEDHVNFTSLPIHVKVIIILIYKSEFLS